MHLAGIITSPTGAWTTQAARILMMSYERPIRFLIRDGAGQFPRGFDDVFRSDDITIIRTPPRTPVANAYAERWVGTVRRELCDRTLIWNRRQLEQLLREFAVDTAVAPRGILARETDDCPAGLGDGRGSAGPVRVGRAFRDEAPMLGQDGRGFHDERRPA